MDAIQEYADFHTLRNSSPRYIEEVERKLRTFSKALQKPVETGKQGSPLSGHRPVESAVKREVEGYLLGLKKRGCKASTVEGWYRVLSAFFNWAVVEEILPASPMTNIPKPTFPEEQVKPLTVEELQALLSTVDTQTFTGQRDRLLILLMADSGLRVSEVLSIRLKDICQSTQSITVMGKGSKERTVYYGQAVRKALQIYLRKRGTPKPTDLLIVNSLGEQMLRFAVTERIREYGAKAGIVGKRCSSHTLRHTAAVLYLKNGGDALSLQRLLGHSTCQMTARYVLFSSSDLADKHKSASPMDHIQWEGQEKERRKRLR